VEGGEEAVAKGEEGVATMASNMNILSKVLL